MQKKYFLAAGILFLTFSLASNASAGKLASQEAVNYYNEGVRAQKTKNFRVAEIAFQKAALVDPTDVRVQKALLNNRAIAYVREGDLQSAEEIFNELLKMDPNDMKAKMNLGLIYERTRGRLECLEYWAKVFNWEEAKPKDFLLEQEIIKPEKGK